ncbi:MAG: hypothetical protein U1F17_06595 [Burkholderiaceae bacterium]
MGASLSTVRRMEKGDARSTIHFFARALHVFGEIQALAHLLDTPNDEIGLTLMDAQLPKRVRSKRSASGALLSRRAYTDPTASPALHRRAGLPVGSLAYVEQGRRENSAIVYDESGWRTRSGSTSTDCSERWATGLTASPHDSVFHGALAGSTGCLGPARPPPATMPGAARAIHASRPSPS